jgi:hypothetical protein
MYANGPCDFFCAAGTVLAANCADLVAYARRLKLAAIMINRLAAVAAAVGHCERGAPRVRGRDK